MRNILVLSCTIIAMPILIGCGKKIDTSKEAEKLLATDVEFSNKSAEVGAVDAFNAFLADDALQLPAQSQPIKGRENIYTQMKEGGGKYVLRWKPEKAEVAQSGELGWTWGTYTLSYDDSAGKQTRYGKYVNVWRKQVNGLWKVVVDIGNQNAAPSQ